MGKAAAGAFEAVDFRIGDGRMRRFTFRPGIQHPQWPTSAWKSRQSASRGWVFLESNSAGAWSLTISADREVSRGPAMAACASIWRRGFAGRRRLKDHLGWENFASRIDPTHPNVSAAAGRLASSPKLRQAAMIFLLIRVMVMMSVSGREGFEKTVREMCTLKGLSVA